MFFEKLSSLYLAHSSWVPGIVSSSSHASQAMLGDASAGKFVWDNVPATKDLIYHDCFGEFQCARLQVPMDWNAPPEIDNRTVEIAVIRLPATVPVTDPRYGGAVVINPGGPGGSGVKLALREARNIRTVVSAGPDTAKDNTARHFDIVSFDPRGVNNTKPIFTCFPDHIQMTAFELESAEFMALSSSDTAFAIEWARMRAFASTCSQRSVEAGIGEHLSTPYVARDIIEIVERHGEWREREAAKLLQPAGRSRAVYQQQKEMLQQQDHFISDEEAAEVMARVAYKPGKEMVQYWGFSYGTVLGATLSAMFPERVARVVLDGVCDSFDYMEGGWLTNLQDTDMEIIKFGEYCWLGGPEHCALYHEDGPAAIVDTFASIFADIKANPIGVPAQGGYAAGVATYSDLKQLFRDKSYKPLRNFHEVARIMSEIKQGNATGLVKERFEKRKSLEEGLSDKCKASGAYSMDCFDNGKGWDGSGGIGIRCTDALDQTNMTKEEYWEYVTELMGQSTLMGETWATIRMPCTQWTARSKWRYEGNFTAHTAHPVLFVSNTADNVTPLRNAIRMSAGFDGSVILQQDSEGHCSSSSPSFCTARTLRTYFQTGQLPANGSLCLPDRRPLDGFSEEVDPKLPEGETEVELWKAMVAMSLN